MCDSNPMRCGSLLWLGPMAGIDVVTSLHAAVLTPVVCVGSFCIAVHDRYDAAWPVSMLCLEGWLWQVYGYPLSLSAPLCSVAMN